MGFFNLPKSISLNFQLMKKFLFLYIIATMSLISQPVYAQSDTASLGLPGDNLDLYAVLNLFQKSKTIEGFEKSLNDEKEGINNLDLNLDKKVDFIKVVTQKGEDSSYTFVLQVDVTKSEKQDVAVILLNKENGRVSLQMVGDEELYGKDYVIEPKGNSSITANPGYKGEDPVVVNVPATTVTVVQSAPIVQYVYSPAYVPYYPPYYYGYYPPWFGFATVMAVGIYRHNNWYHHGGYYGGHYHGGNNNVIINNGNRNNINHYNNSRNRSTTVSDNMSRGNYGNRTSTNNRPSTTNRATTNNVSNNRASTSNNRASTTNRATTNTRPSTNNNVSNNRASSSNFNKPSTSNFSSSSMGSSRTRSSGGSSFSGGGGMRSGGGGGRRR